MFKKLLTAFFSEAVIVDTNIFVAANWSRRSSAHVIVEALKTGRLRLVYSPAIYRETRFILGKAKTREDFRRQVDEIFQKGLRVLPKRNLRVIAQDPEDDKYLSCADSSPAKFIISNDKHLLNLKKFGRVKILTSHKFRHEYL